MHYLFLAYEDEGRADIPPHPDRSPLERGYWVNEDALRRSGHLVAAADMRGADANKTVRIRGGEVISAGSGTIWTNVQLASIFLIDARDLNDAIRVACAMPHARGGLIEVRPMSSIS